MTSIDLLMTASRQVVETAISYRAARTEYQFAKAQYDAVMALTTQDLLPQDSELASIRLEAVYDVNTALAKLEMVFGRDAEQ